ncbi:3-methylcrotonyl-CoA carboxylase alpha subunit [Natronospira proteinivora]|uniref:3-methylcrotonyl-CoA carboxylase alpha subunit n=1 Tax=Natronospira proteinivora TaxID=1807133 RepID=A0ABT1G4A6_9GAMM|nr:acetyl/propionyl/methylcrotonyl-CoA carboxylase subunit alpha [Natronospira proteinivora]MCP1726129.1 3-methylcrotonyl-CoA carboxylase alpha subunit [Natronospira proteinivora]
MFKKVLIANRGEIACRIMESCRALGVKTVAVYSDADAGARHVRMADEAVHIGPAAAAESYLKADRILEVARETGAEAVHPGYGFLSENTAFARACQKAGIVFIGPKPDSIDQMGSKSASKTIMEKAGVPVVPGYHGDDQSNDILISEAKKIGFPLMIKAVSGGGGKGMRVVREEKELQTALDGARREGKSSFGDDRVLLEKFIEQPRHIEFQVFGDSQGNVIHLFERECSLQRRYQKIVEETPSPALDDKLRAEMGEAAVNAAKAVDYINAGTVEFIMGADGGFYFMEMNTRLQVEHPVTEMTTGLDLVEWQLRVADGEPLPLEQDEIEQFGHAFEVRIYAEKVAEGFLPSVGTVSGFDCPEEEDGVRLDTGVEAGDEISIHYDPMVAKLIVFDEDREQSLRLLRDTLARTAVFGLDTNLSLLRAIAADDRFSAGDMDTGMVDQRLDAWTTLPAPTPGVLAAAAVYRQLELELDREDGDDPISPWNQPDGWRVSGDGGLRVRLAAAGEEQDIWLQSVGPEQWALSIGEESLAVALVDVEADALVLAIDGHAKRFDVLADGDDLQITEAGVTHVLKRIDPYAAAGGAAADEAHPGSPMPGRIVAVHVKEGDRVEVGDPILVLEGMKMEFTVKAGVAGTVEKLKHGEGDMVEAEVPLVDIQADG